MDGPPDKRKRPASIDYWNDAVKKPRTKPPVPGYNPETKTSKRPTVQIAEGNRHNSYTVPPRDGSAVLPSPGGTMIASSSPLSAEASHIGSVSRRSTPQSAMLLSHGRAPLAQTRESQNTSAQTTSPRATKIFAQLENFAASITAKNLTAFSRDVAQTRFEQICREIDENAQHLASFPTLNEQKNHVKDQAAKTLEDLNKKLVQRKEVQDLVILKLANEIESCQLAANTTLPAYSEAENLKLEKSLEVTKDIVDGQDRAIKSLREEVSALREKVKTSEAFRTAANDEFDRLQGDVNRLQGDVNRLQVESVRASQSAVKLDSLSNHVTPSGDEILKLSSDLTALKSTVDTHSSKLKALSDDLEEKDNEGLRKVVAAQGDTLYGHEIQLADASTDRDKLWDRINELQPASGDAAEQDLETLERPRISLVVPYRPNHTLANGNQYPPPEVSDGDTTNLRAEILKLQQRCSAHQQFISSLEERYNNLTTEEMAQKIIHQMQAMYPYSPRSIENRFNALEVSAAYTSEQLRGVDQRVFQLSGLARELGLLHGRVGVMERNPKASFLRAENFDRTTRSVGQEVAVVTPKDVRSIETDNNSIRNEIGTVKADIGAMRTDANRQNLVLSRLEGRVQRPKDAVENSIGERIP
ncbi:hypothetical protein LTR39_003557 [Cryomyces antarcticus]|nr:hypothetical protein LTR39_003557 [Cryomyces antarcticus]